MIRARCTQEAAECRCHNNLCANRREQDARTLRELDEVRAWLKEAPR